VDIKGEPWASCPLKHEIRATLWEPYIRGLTGGATLIRYLTLYSPSQMDVKYFVEKGHISFNGGLYKGVVGVTYSRREYAEMVGTGIGRPELLIEGDINDILTNRKNTDNKKLLQTFPFQVINLDYTNSLFYAEIRDPISSHIQALETIFNIQNRKNCDRFCLFLTTRADDTQFSKVLLQDLQQRINENINSNVDFGQTYLKVYRVNTGEALRASYYQDFATLGLIKFILVMLSEVGYEAINSGAIWLIRDLTGKNESLLHLAFIIEKRSTIATNVIQYGRRQPQYYTAQAIKYMTDRAKNGLKFLKETMNNQSLQKKHGPEIAKLMSQTYQLKIPNQTSGS
jgi:hypothetical protein